MAKKTDRKKHDGTIPEDETADDVADAYLDQFEYEDLGAVSFEDERNESVPERFREVKKPDPEIFGPATVEMLQRILFSDPGEYMHWGNRGVTLKDSEDLTPLQRMLVSSVSEDKDGNVKLQLCSKDQALRLLGQAAGIYKNDVNLSGKVDIGLLDVLKEIDGKTRGLPPKQLADKRAGNGKANGNGRGRE